MTSETTRGPGGVSHVRDGMTVLDVDGEEIGTVVEVHMGDPDAVTADGQDFGAGLGDHGAPPVEVQDHLLRTGYVCVKTKGLFRHKRWVSADDVVSVEDDRVRLSLHEKGLIG